MKNVVNIPYGQAQELLDRFNLRSQFEADPQGVVNQLKLETSDPTTEYNFDALINANPLVKARNWLSRKTASGVEEYVNEPIRNTFGDNTATRILTTAASGLADAAPELAMLIATRGRGAGHVIPKLGTAAAGVSAGVNRYGQIGDTNSALVAGLTTAAMPTVIRGMQKVTAPLTTPLSGAPRTLANFGVGVGGGVASNIPDIAYSPKMTQYTTQEGVPAFAYPETPVRLNDFGEAGNRLVEFAKDPVQVGAMILAEVGGGAVAHRMSKKAIAEAQAREAHSTVQPISEPAVATDMKAILTDYGIDVPAGTDVSTIAKAVDQLAVTGTANKNSIQKDIYNSVGKNKLTPEQQSKLAALEENDDLLNVVASEAANVKLPESSMNNGHADYIRAVEDINPDYDPTAVSKSPIRNAMAKIFDLALPLNQRVADNPVAKAIYQKLADTRAQSDKKVNDIWIKLGQNADGSFTPTEALTNTKNILTRMATDSKFADTVGKIYLDNQERLLRNDVKKVGNKEVSTTKRREVFDQLPQRSIEELQSTYGISKDVATFVHNTENLPVQLAKDTFDTNSFRIENIMADKLWQKFPERGNIVKQLELAKQLNEAAKKRAGEYVILRKQRERNANAPKVDKEQAIADLAIEYYNKFLFPERAASGADVLPADFNTAYSLALVNFEAQRANFNTYIHNSMTGYAPMTRNGRYQVAWTEAGSTPGLSGFKDKAAATAFAKKLREQGATSVIETDVEYNPKFWESRIAFEQARSFRKDLSETINNIRGIVDKIDPSVIDESLVNELNGLAKEVEVDYTDIGKYLSSFDLLKTTTLERKNIQGANGVDLVKNLLTLSEAMTRANESKRTNSLINLMMKDPTVANDPNMFRLLENKINYMRNRDLAEFQPVRSVATTWYLAGSLGYLAANMAQVPIFGASTWRGRTGRSLANFVKSATEATKVIHDYDHSIKPSNKDNILFRILKQAENDKVFDQKYSEETYGRRIMREGIADLDTPPTAGEKFHRKLDNVMDWITQIITDVEVLNRKWAFTTYLVSENNYKPLSERSPQEIARIYQNAREFSDNDVNFTGGKAVRPDFIQRAGKAGSFLHGTVLSSMALKNFQLNVGGVLLRQLKQSMPKSLVSKSTASKQFLENRSAAGLLTTLTVLGALAGFTGIPLTRELDSIIVKLFGEKNRPSRKVTSNLADLFEEAAELLDKEEETDDPEYNERIKARRAKILDYMNYGLPALTGVHMQNVGVGQISPIDPNDSSIVKYLGAPASMVQGFFEGSKAGWSGDWETFKRNATPSALKNVLNFIDVISKGQMFNRKGEALTNPNEISGVAETIAPLFGGVPTQVAKQRSQSFETQNFEREMNSERSTLYEMLSHLTSRPEQLAKAMRKAVEKNVISLDTDEEVDGFYRALAERAVKQRERVDDLSSARYAQDTAQIARERNTSQIGMAELDRILAQIRIASSVGDWKPAMRYAQKISAQQAIAKHLIREKGMRPEVARLLLKENKTIDDLMALRRLSIP